ncbi:hypothetical protein VR41_15025 [Streptomyces sp. NRRL B-1568]|nr:hypothetical protein VR41_15025 [Streptomyces sp. NRRL B-1568]
MTPHTVPSAPAPMSDRPGPGMLTHGFWSSLVYREISWLELTPHTLVLDPTEIADRPPVVCTHRVEP